MSGLYPDILFHFTSKDGLYGILENFFAASYARERIVGNRKSTSLAVPMVSFCDLRLSELKDHMDKYGPYGIGLSKKWANRKGLNPVFYVNKHCDFTSNFIAAIEQIRKQISSISDPTRHSSALDSYNEIVNSYRYIKNYEGDLVRKNGITTRNYRFANEREWRYVPPQSAASSIQIPLDKITTDEQKAELNNLIANKRLDFQPDDIMYLVVESDSERLGLINHLDKAKSKFSEAVRRQLASKILTSEQIKNDI
jgi:hypothetical protein